MRKNAFYQVDLQVDLHVHTTVSDGSDSPEAVVALAKERGVQLLAVADHNTMDGVAVATAAGQAAGVPILPAVEIDVDCARGELHLLAYGVDAHAPALRALLEGAQRDALERNLGVLRRLEAAGYALDVDTEGRTGAQVHVATRQALLERGFAKDRKDVYVRFMLHPDYYRDGHRPSAEEVLRAVAEAGGVVSLAHPCKLKIDDAETVRRLADGGLWGIEAYYGDGGEPYIPRALAFARRYGLAPTIGSDYHGTFRSSSLGMRAPEDPKLRASLEYLSQWAR